VKIYRHGESGEGGGTRYSPSRLTGIKKARGVVKPDMDKISTSSEFEAHANAISLHFAYYNLVRVHQTLRMTPAMAVAVADRLWEVAGPGCGSGGH
jgi:hypothetical protein